MNSSNFEALSASQKELIKRFISRTEYMIAYESVPNLFISLPSNEEVRIQHFTYNDSLTLQVVDAIRPILYTADDGIGYADILSVISNHASENLCKVAEDILKDIEKWRTSNHFDQSAFVESDHSLDVSKSRLFQIYINDKKVSEKNLSMDNFEADFVYSKNLLYAHKWHADKTRIKKYNNYDEFFKFWSTIALVSSTRTAVTILWMMNILCEKFVKGEDW